MRASSDITKNSWGLLVDVLRVDSGRVTAQPAITGRVLTMTLTVWPQLSRNSQDGTESELETYLKAVLVNPRS